MASQRTTFVSSPAYQQIRNVLIRAREAALRSQKELAARVGCPVSMIRRIERGQRPIDLLEFCVVARALDLDPAFVLNDICVRIGRLSLASSADAPPEGAD
jgi:transcriptional regulator with XRE-family HTH domain